MPQAQALRSFLAILLAAVCTHALALDPSLQPSQYVLDNWQIAEGLPQSSAQALARTPDGYLWVGTQEGLARFDGVRFTVFDGGNEPAIPNKHISVLFVDGASRLWIGTRSGLAVLENGQFRPVQSVAGLEHAYIRAIVGGKMGRVWVGTENGFFEIAGASTCILRCDERIAGRAHPCALGGPRRGAVGRHASAASSASTASASTRSPLPGTSADTPVTAIHQDADGTLWVGTGTGALYRRAADHFIVVAEPGRYGSVIRALARDQRRQPVDWHTRRRPGEVARRQVQRARQQRVRQ